MVDNTIKIKVKHPNHEDERGIINNDIVDVSEIKAPELKKIFKTVASELEFKGSSEQDLIEIIRSI